MAEKKWADRVLAMVTASALGMLMLIPAASPVAVNAECATTADVTAYIDDLKETTYTEGISWYDFYSDEESIEAYQGIQHVGFARHIGEMLFGTHPGTGITTANTGTVQNGWVAYRPDDVAYLQPGDIIHTAEHSAVVHYVSGTDVYVIEAWGDHDNEIHYGYFNGSSANPTLADIKSNFNFYGIWRYGALIPEEENTLVSIAVDEASVGTVYENGSTFTSDGMTLTATYFNGSTQTITSGYTVGSSDFTEPGTKEMTVTYEDKTAVLNVTVQDLFAGSGTETDPYQIGTAADLKNLADMVNNTAANDCYGTAHYIQTADIDLYAYDWTPIGIYLESPTSSVFSKKAVFKGTYNGNYHKVENVKVNYGNLYAGLFGRLNYNQDSAVVENLSVTGDVTGTQSSIGGIVGEAGYGAVIRNCDFTGTVNGVSNVGGIVGKVHQGGTISNCYANAAVTASDGYAGGIAGYAAVAGSTYSTDILLENCYYAGNGIDTGLVSGTTVGGIAGAVEVGMQNDTSISISNCYYLDSAANGAVAGEAYAGCMSMASADLKALAADLGSPYVDNPYDLLNDGYPIFEWQLEVKGDANGDGEVNLEDIIYLQKYLLGLNPLDSRQFANADMNANGAVNAFDLALLKNYLLYEIH